MSFFNDMLIDNNSDWQINGTTIPMPTEPPEITYNNISDGGRLADDITYVGSLKGVKRTIKLKYSYMNKAHYDTIFGLTQGRYNSGGSFQFSLKIPTYTSQGIQTMTVYFMSQHNNKPLWSTEAWKDTLGSSYGYGGVNYDELHKDIEFTFTEC